MGWFKEILIEKEEEVSIDTENPYTRLVEDEGFFVEIKIPIGEEDGAADSEDNREHS